jgi:hypothetical protein
MAQRASDLSGPLKWFEVFGAKNMSLPLAEACRWLGSR